MLKRITDRALAQSWLDAEQSMGFLRNVTVDDIMEHRIVEYDDLHGEFAANAQLQADLKALEACHPDIQDMLSYWRDTIRNGADATNPGELADQIISLLKGEE